MKKILIHSDDYLGDKIAGLAIRCIELGRELSKDFEVTLTIFRPCNSKISEFQILTVDKKDLKDILKTQDVLISQGLYIQSIPALYNFDIPFIIDIYCPFFIENLETLKKEKFSRETANSIAMVQRLFQRGDFFICANEKQRDLWLAFLFACGRITPEIYQEDPSLKNLIQIVPFALPKEEPQKTKRVLKGAYKNIKETDKVIIWWGGIWDWLDPLTLISAMAEIVKTRSDVKLIFWGKHPSPQAEVSAMFLKAQDLAQKLGLTDKYIFWENWIPYEERANYLLEADIGIVTHFNHLETRFSWRTRILDYLWADLPIIITEGDPTGEELIQKHNLGLVVPEKDPLKLKEAILKILDSPSLAQQFQENIQKIKALYHWENVIQPVKEFCQNPKKTADRKAMFWRRILNKV